MDQQHLVANPFALMLHPEEVVRAMKNSGALDRLARRICRPLENQCSLAINGIVVDDEDSEYDDS